jgi:hypothetical protein
MIGVDQLEKSFQRAMVAVYEDAKRETGYNALRFLQMISNVGGVEAAKRLLHASHVSDGFTALWERKRLDLTVESVVLRPEFADLFTDDELDLARRRLEDYGYLPPG